MWVRCIRISLLRYDRFSEESNILYIDLPFDSNKLLLRVSVLQISEAHLAVVGEVEIQESHRVLPTAYTCETSVRSSVRLPRSKNLSKSVVNESCWELHLAD